MLNLTNYFYLIISACLILTFESCTYPNETIILEGEWTVVLDSMNVGEQEKWYESNLEGVAVNLPGTLDLAGLGKKSDLVKYDRSTVFAHLQREREYIGKAWYQKEINISGDLAAQNLELSLERVLWKSDLWINGKYVGSQESLVAPHQFDLKGFIVEGKNSITVRVDNSSIYPNINIIGDKYSEASSKNMAHAYTNHTQIIWNGILGKMSLKPMDKIKNIQVDSDIENKKLFVTAEILSAETEVRYRILEEGEVLEEGNLNLSQNSNLEKYELTLNDKVKPWDEFNPSIYELELTINGFTTSQKFAVRKISSSDNAELLLNGNRIFLRGTLECAVFPLTGFPPTDKSSWLKIINSAKSYGLNHFRFHSWCPPKAAFEAADELGFYIQAELPHWNLKVGMDQKTNEFLENEAELILKNYGNHPSFILMALGNELEGDISYMNEFVKNLKNKDPRRLYTTTSFSFQRGMGRLPQAEDEFFVTQWTDKGWIRGQGIFNDEEPSFDKDYQNELDHILVPIISHEIGQYSVYPDLSEIEKYTGVLKAMNFQAVRDDLESKGLLDLAAEFTHSSGRLAAILYKEEIERALKTPGFDGYQLLQLQDFPGQGTALVGLLNVFWESKGIISEEEFSMFNKEVVPLVRFEKSVYKSGAEFNAEIQIANFYKKLENQKINWTIKDKDKVVDSGEVQAPLVTVGNQNFVGEISSKLIAEKPSKYMVRVEIEGYDYANEWPIWVYPEVLTNSNVKFTRSFEEAKRLLENGETVLLNPEVEALKGVEGRFVPVFWSPVHFPDQPSTMGILCDPSHSAFGLFPTDLHSNWQWWDLCVNSRAISLEGLGIDTPIVRVIDNFVTNRSLGLVFESKVGKGKLLFTSIDLGKDLENRLVAKQLKSSLTAYMQSSEFDPSKTIDFSEIEKLRME